MPKWSNSKNSFLENVLEDDVGDYVRTCLACQQDKLELKMQGLGEDGSMAGNRCRFKLFRWKPKLSSFGFLEMHQLMV